MRTGCSWWKTSPSRRCDLFTLIREQCNPRNLLRATKKRAYLKRPSERLQEDLKQSFAVWVLDIVMTVLGRHLDYIRNELKTQAAGHIWEGFFLTESFEVGRPALNLGHTSWHPCAVGLLALILAGITACFWIPSYTEGQRRHRALWIEQLLDYWTFC